MLIYLLFLCSGASALIWEISWSRQVGLVVGNTAEAAAVVLAAFFTGLGLGQFAGGRLSGWGRPLLAYGVAELAGAMWATTIPTLLTTIDAATVGDTLTTALCFLALLPATIPLGATFPFVAEHLSRRSARRASVALAYGLNTVGGLVGVIAATMFLHIVGVRGSCYVAAAISTLCGMIACALSRLDSPSARLGSQLEPEPIPVIWWAIATLSGFGTLGLEVLYTRLFSLVFHNSTYTFGAVVAVFLAGLAIGAALVAAVGQRLSQRSLIASGCVFGAVAVAGSVVVFVRWTGFDYFTAGDGFAAYFVGAIWLVAVVVLPPTILLGATLPALFTAQSGRTLGSLAAANTAGSVAGALVSEFLFVPTLGLWATFALFVILLGFAGVLLLLRGVAWVVSVAASLTIVLAAILVGSAPARGTHGQQEELVRRWESAYGWIDVTRTTKTGDLRVRQNLHYRHGSTTNALREYRQGRLPLLLHSRPNEVAFLGIGTGLTAAPIVADSEVRKAVVVELIPEVVEAARLLSDANLGVVDHQKVQLHVGDARHFLRSTDRRFDVIVADLFVPWESRSGYLYTVEFYEAARQRLSPGGHFCQWLALYQFGRAEFELVANSFAAVFPNVTLWWGQLDSRFPIVALIGTDRDLSTEHLNERLPTSGSPGGHDPELASPSDLAGLYLGRWPRSPSRLLNTDEHPLLEFTAPLSQQSGRRLSGQPLRLYYDEVLADLPESGVRFMEFTRPDSVSRRMKQRLGLVGSSAW